MDRAYPCGAQLLPERERRNAWRLIKRADGMRLERDPSDRPLVAQPVCERIDRQRRPRKSAGESAFPFESVLRGDRSGLSQSGRRPTIARDNPRLIAPFVGYGGEGL